MSTSSQSRFTPSASPLRVGVRLAVLAAVCGALVAGFVVGVAPPAQAPGDQVARTPAACAEPTC